MNRKIEIFSRGKYICTTTQSKTCKEAKLKFLRLYPQFADVKAKFKEPSHAK